MNIYCISGFQSHDVPHWSVAYVEANSPIAAKSILADRIVGDQEKPETVWDVTDMETWTVGLAERPFMFILGGGCR